MSYNWKIIEVHADGETITKAKYYCVLIDGDQTVETEGYCTFNDPKINVPFAEVTEEIMIGWVETELGEIVKTRLAEQLQEKSKPVTAPWLPQIFTPNI